LNFAVCPLPFEFALLLTALLLSAVHFHQSDHALKVSLPAQSLEGAISFRLITALEAVLNGGFERVQSFFVLAIERLRSGQIIQYVGIRRRSLCRDLQAGQSWGHFILGEQVV
jgi:hypothetical protein